LNDNEPFRQQYYEEGAFNYLQRTKKEVEKINSHNVKNSGNKKYNQLELYRDEENINMNT